MLQGLLKVSGFFTAGVGFAAPDVALDRLPGWDGHSYGYHGDDGFAFTSNAGKGQNYGPTYKDGRWQMCFSVIFLVAGSPDECSADLYFHCT